MKCGFQSRKRLFRPRGLTLLLAAAVILVLIIYQLDRVIVPFQSENPLWHEITAGQVVIDNWKYGGEDAEGYMEFYQDGDPHEHLLPPNERILGLDGTFVVIEHHTDSSLTYAEPIDAIPMRWILYGLGLMSLPATFICLRIRARRKRVRLRIRKPMPIRVDKKLRTPRFRPHGFQRK